MEDDTPTSHIVELKEVFCKLLTFAIRERFPSNAKMIKRYAHTSVKPWKLILDQKSSQILRISVKNSLALIVEKCFFDS